VRAVVSEQSGAARFLSGADLDPSDPYAREAETFPRLTEDQVERVAAFGAIERLPQNTILFKPGDRRVDFFLVLDGYIEIYEPRGGTAHVMTVHAKHQFTGELDLFNDRAILVGGRMGVDGRVARLSRPQFRRMLAAEPGVANVIVNAFILRREGFIQHGQAAVTILGHRRSAASLALQRFLTRNGHPFLAVDVETDAGATQLRQLGYAHDDTPVVVCGDEQILIRPEPRELGDCLGIAEPPDDRRVFDVVVVGAGPAGLAAAVYSASEGLDTVVLEADAPGGQAGTSSRIENYLGFPTGLAGQDLAHRAQIQAQKFGARVVVPRRVTRLVADERPYILELDDDTRVRTHTVILATGARYRTLDLDNVGQFEGSGIHYAATAVEAALCEGEEAIVVGGGNSAGQAAVFLSRHASHVHILIRGATLSSSMSDYLISRIEAVPERITVHPFTEITALQGNRHLERVTWSTRPSGPTETRPIPNVFLMLGAVPNTDWLAGVVALDAKGFVRTGVPTDADASSPPPLQTSRHGIFAVGDVRSESIKRVASAVGEGSVVVSSVHRTLPVR
jgi:thioredoxin reductase (NADPH)